MAEEGRPATYDEVITAIAKQHGVNPSLALAVADTESKFDPNAVGQSVKGQNARGIFQLMPETAQELGVTDPHDPIQNITGGVKYLRQLQDQFKDQDGNSDVEKVLQAYNGGARHIGEGTVSEGAKAYATGIISKMSRAAATQQQISGAGGPPPGTPAPEQKSKPSFLARTGKFLTSGINPTTPEGLEGLGGLAGGTIGGVVTGGNPLGAAAGAMLGGQAGGLVNQAIEGFQGRSEEAARKIRNAGFEQGAYEVGGRLLWWPLASFGRGLLATEIGQAAKKGLTGAVETATGAYKAAMGAAKEKFVTAVGTATSTAREATQAAIEAGEKFKGGVASTGEKAVAEAKAAASAGKETARNASAERQAAADLEAADLRSTAEAQHAALVNQPPSQAELAGTTRETLGGLPGLHKEETGPVKAALDIAGKHVAEVAKEGPELATSEVKSAFDQMVGEARPEALFPQPKAATAVGFGPQAVKGAAAAELPAAATVAKNMTAEQVAQRQAQIVELLTKKGVQLPPNHPLPGVLAQVQEGLSHEKLSFEEAHRLKTLLDEAVNWDRNAKGYLQQITKGVRVALRKALGSFEPYNEATAAAGALYDLVRKPGAGKRFISIAISNPGRVAGFLNAADSQSAAQVKQLLVDTAAKGGNPELGQRAWDAVRSHFTYEKIIRGSADELLSRVKAMMAQRPEFVKTVFGDQSGQAVLDNLRTIGQAIKTAGEAGAAKQAGAKAAGVAEKAAAGQAGEAGIAKATTEAKTAAREAAQQVSESVRQRRIAGAQDIAATKRTAGKEFATTAEQEGAKLTGARENLRQMRESTMGPYMGAQPRATGADVAALAISHGWNLGNQARAVWRLVHGPAGADLIQAAAHSTPLAQKVARVLGGEEGGYALAHTLRTIIAGAKGMGRERREAAAQEEPAAVNQ